VAAVVGVACVKLTVAWWTTSSMPTAPKPSSSGMSVGAPLDQMPPSMLAAGKAIFDPLASPPSFSQSG